MRVLTAETNIFYAAENFAVNDFENENWLKAEFILLTRYWSGAPAPPHRRATARLLWTNENLLVRFDCCQQEPLIISRNPQTEVETANLWERDVCEIFVAPDADKPQKYFEFEVAPTGEWLDYAILQRADTRETDASYNSGIKTAAHILVNSFTIIFQINWQAFGKTPIAGEKWLGNLFRCVGAGANRGYLAWQPTLTPQPNFHVPQAFGIFKFEN